MGLPAASLNVLSTELIIEIAGFLSRPSDLAHLILVSRRFAHLFLEDFYRRNVERWNASALLWACQNGVLGTARRSIDAGASVNQLFLPASISGIKSRTPIWPPSFKARICFRLPTANTPLSAAVQARHIHVVRFLLAHGADPNQHDGRAAQDHQMIWFPIHWALSCGFWRNTRQAGSSTNTAVPVPINIDIVAELLHHGANPNQKTLSDPNKDGLGGTVSSMSDEASYPLHMSVCNHVPADAIRLLLESGAHPGVVTKNFGCAGRQIRGLWTVFDMLQPTQSWHFDNELRDRKMNLLAQNGGVLTRREPTIPTVEHIRSKLTKPRMDLLHDIRTYGDSN